MADFGESDAADDESVAAGGECEAVLGEWDATGGEQETTDFKLFTAGRKLFTAGRNRFLISAGYTADHMHHCGVGRHGRVADDAEPPGKIGEMAGNEIAVGNSAIRGAGRVV